MNEWVEAREVVGLDQDTAFVYTDGRIAILKPHEPVKGHKANAVMFWLGTILCAGVVGVLLMVLESHL